MAVNLTKTENAGEPGMYRVTRQIDFCYGHRLLDYEGKCRHLHGHNGRAVITLEADELDARGMVLDFSDIKRVVSRWIDDNLDHRMILRKDDPAAAVLRKLGEPLFLVEANPTAENIAKLIFDFTADHGFPIVEARLWETPQCFATYRSG
jgi:6-pyruvoyltetrahydropterin/6-carboxytetrahydropterin synthase